MVVVTTEGKRFIILFDYLERETPIGPRKVLLGMRRLTNCRILKSTYNDNRTGELLGRGYAICHPNDRFSKAIGRKISLAHAL